MIKKRKTLGKKIAELFSWWAVKVIYRLVALIPLNYLPAMSKLMVKISLPFLLICRIDLGWKNLKLVFGKEKKERELKKIWKEMLENIVLGSMELIHCESFRDHRIEIEGIENLDRYLSQGKGVIGFSGHFGNFVLLCCKLSSMGYPFKVITRDPHNKRIAYFLNDLKRRAGVEFIPDKPKRECVRRSIQCLKENGILLLQIDQNASSRDGIYVEFFGRNVPTFPGPVILSLRTGAPIIPMFIHREKGLQHKLIIEKPVSLSRSDDREKDLKENITRLNKILERYIRLSPSQWWWVHNRWKKAL